MKLAATKPKMTKKNQLKMLETEGEKRNTKPKESSRVKYKKEAKMKTQKYRRHGWGNFEF